MADQGLTGGGGVAFGKDQVLNGQNCIQPFRQKVASRDVVRDIGVFDLALGAHQALGHGRRRDEESCGDLRGGQATQGVQGQRNLLILW
jgi:hypothetical protein